MKTLCVSITFGSGGVDKTVFRQKIKMDAMAAILDVESEKMKIVFVWATHRVQISLLFRKIQSVAYGQTDIKQKDTG